LREHDRVRAPRLAGASEPSRSEVAVPGEMIVKRRKWDRERKQRQRDEARARARAIAQPDDADL